jgi:hypothetical protein
MFTDLFLSDTAVVSIIEEDTRAARASKEERIAQCGHAWGGFFMPSTGLWKSVPFKCNQWRECVSCLNDRATVERQKIEVVSEQMDIRTLELPEDEMNQFCSMMGKKNFRRYPNTELDRVFFISENDDDPGVLVDDDLMHSLDWKQIVLTPIGRKLSGSLGYCPPAGSGSGHKIKVECVMSDAGPELRQQAVQWAIDETKDLRPTTVEEVIEACHTRTGKYKSYLSANGATLFPSRSQMEIVDKADWGGSGYFANREEGVGL